MYLSDRTTPLFKIRHHSGRLSFSMPDYYRSTRREHFGPYYRSSQPARDLMVCHIQYRSVITQGVVVPQRTIDLRVRESVESVCALPDIEEEDEDDFDGMECEAAAQPGDVDDEDTRDDTGQRAENDDKEKRFVRLWHLFMSALRKLRGGQPPLGLV